MPWWPKIAVTNGNTIACTIFALTIFWAVPSAHAQASGTAPTRQGQYTAADITAEWDEHGNVLYSSRKLKAGELCPTPPEGYKYDVLSLRSGYFLEAPCPALIPISPSGTATTAKAPITPIAQFWALPLQVWAVRLAWTIWITLLVCTGTLLCAAWALLLKHMKPQKP